VSYPIAARYVVYVYEPSKNPRWDR